MGSISQRGVRELQLISTRKQSFLLKGPSTVLPVTWQGLPSCPSTSSLKAGNPNLRWGPPKPITSRSHCLGFSFEAYHLPHPLPAKPQSSTVAWTGQWGRCSQRVWLCKSGGTLPTLHENCRWLCCSWEPRGGALGKVKCKLGYSKETLFFPSPELKRWCPNW